MKPTKIVKGRGFCRLLSKASNISDDEYSGNIVHVGEVSLIDSESQYVDLIFYLKNGYAPTQLDHKRKRDLRLKSNQYQIIDNVFFRKNYESVLLRCLEKFEA